MTPPPPLSAKGGSKKAYVYLLRSLRDGKFYFGWTTDLKRRLEKHNRGLTPSTGFRTPFELVYYETFDSAKVAKERERKLKHCPNMYFNFKKRALSNGPSGQREVVG